MAAILPSSNGETTTPLPDFVFPARPSPSSSAPSSFSKATSRRPISAVDFTQGFESSSMGRAEGSRRSTPAALPLFSFNPSEPTSSDLGIASPPLSPQPLSPQHRPIPSRANIHKRGTSEYIGGDGSTGSGLGLMSTSPTKGDNVLPTPGTLSTMVPKPNRRGHAHRRSAAISQGDLSFILKPSDPNAIRGSSAPCSPSVDEKDSPFPGIESLSSQEPEQSTLPPKANRARVGFSDDIQFIPRPLSLVSSESSGTTIRPGGHSVSGSLSSIISASGPSSKEQRLSPQPVDARPKTAAARLDSSGPISPTLDGPTPRRHRSNPLLPDLSAMLPDNPPTPKSPNKLWSFFSGNDSPHSRPTSAASYKDPHPQVLTPKSPTIPTPDIAITSVEPTVIRRTSIASRKKKQKKVKSWAGSILSRKARQRSQKQSRRSPTPPHRSYGSMDASTIDLPTLEVAPINEGSAMRPEVNTDFSSWVPRRVYTQDDENTMSPIIDLDAALGPFNTPTGRDADWDAANGTGSRKGRRMHSAAGMGNFGGPGMHYHRRAASSPELENPRFGIRQNASSTMADVFEEEEEDAWEDSKSSVNGRTEDDEESGIDIKVVDADNMDVDKVMDWTVDNDDSSRRGVKRRGSGLSEGERRHMSSSMKSTASSNSLKDDTIFEEPPSPVEIFDDSIPPRPDSGAHSSESTATPPFYARPPKDLALVDIQPFSLQQPYLSPSSPHSTAHSSLPSPRSPFSYDTQRISTAPSSVADEGGFQSLLLGEPGPELRMSIDIQDVPSLASSNSTMTRDSNFIPVANNPQFRDGQRSASFSAAVSRKRSSMASLSRLISSSHGEKSKLSMEVRAPSIDSERKEKSSKSKRISRLVQFWKPKESS